MKLPNQKFVAPSRSCRLRIAALVLSLGCAVLPRSSSAWYADYPPADHEGHDLTLDYRDEIWGLHKNIGTLTIAAGTTCTVITPESDEQNVQGVWLEAEHVRIAGALDATATGFRGGWGGSVSVGDDPATSGTGPFPGIPLAPGDDASSSTWGGYLAPVANGDTTTGPEIFQGSGGAGGWAQGYYLDCDVFYTCFENPYQGYYGGRGGGIVRICAKQTLSLEPEAAIICDGERPFPIGNLGGQYPGAGGGAGGGILINAADATTVTLAQGSTLSCTGADGSLQNGGTAKIFYNPTTTFENKATIAAGRVFSSTQLAPQPADLAIAGGSAVCARRNSKHTTTQIGLTTFVANLGDAPFAGTARLLLLQPDDSVRGGLRILKRIKLKKLEAQSQTVTFRFWPRRSSYYYIARLDISGPNASRENDQLRIEYRGDNGICTGL